MLVKHWVFHRLLVLTAAVFADFQFPRARDPNPANHAAGGQKEMGFLCALNSGVYHWYLYTLFHWSRSV